MITTRDEAITALACWYAASVANIKKSAATPEARLWAADYYAVQLAALVAAGVQTVNETMAQAVIDGKANDEIVKFWETMQESIPRQAEEVLWQTISRLTAPALGGEEKK